MSSVGRSVVKSGSGGTISAGIGDSSITGSGATNVVDAFISSIGVSSG